MVLPFVLSFLAVLVPAAHCGNLLVFPHGGSHWLNMKIIIEGLHSRGHNVSVIRFSDSRYINETSPYYHTISVDVASGAYSNMFMSYFSDSVKMECSEESLWKWLKSTLLKLRQYTERNRNMCQAVSYIFENKELINALREANFETVLTDPMHGGGVMLAHFLKLPLVLNTRATILNEGHRLVAPSPLSFIPSQDLKFTDQMTFFERLQNILAHTIRDSFFLMMARPYSALATTYFGADVDYLTLFQAADLWLMRVDFVFEFPRPTMPNIVYMGGFHCKPAKPLPPHLEEFVQSSREHGVIIMSLGTLIDDLPRDLADEIGAAFAKLPQKVIWRYKGETPATLGNNTLLVDWMPQNDLLGHPKTKVFVAHGGTNGIFEAIYHGVPIIGIPITFDQPANLFKIQTKGGAEVLHMTDLNEKSFYEIIQKVMNEPSYRTNMQRLSRLHRDVPLKPLDRALFWIEFVMRNKGAAHLRTESYKMPWYSYYSVDVFVFLLAAALLLLLILIIALHSVCRLCSKRKLKSL